MRQACNAWNVVSAEENSVIDSTVKIAAAGGVGFTHKCQLPRLKATLRSDTCISCILAVSTPYTFSCEILQFLSCWVLQLFVNVRRLLISFNCLSCILCFNTVGQVSGRVFVL